MASMGLHEDKWHLIQPVQESPDDTMPRGSMPKTIVACGYLLYASLPLCAPWARRGAQSDQAWPEPARLSPATHQSPTRGALFCPASLNICLILPLAISNTLPSQSAFFKCSKTKQRQLATNSSSAQVIDARAGPWQPRPPPSKASTGAAHSAPPVPLRRVRLHAVLLRTGSR